MTLPIPSGTGIAPARFSSIVDEYLNLWPHLPVQHAAKGQFIVDEGDFADSSILLLDGWMALSKTLPDGERQIIDVLLPGDFVLLGASVAPVAACSVEALSDASYTVLTPERANGPEPVMARLRTLLAAVLVTTQARTAELLLRLGKSSAASRTAYALLELYVRLEPLGLASDGRFSLPMTQQKIGEFVGLSNVHVCRTMRRLERDGIISHPAPGEIRIDDLEALSRIADIDLALFREEILLRRPS
ncbi:Crp/Fnr family transcriptional regulator [Marivita sp. GX14005]|uniref:Crp/Fnr family transcriptional regulator n=1 Tax=Marivita sp. GX14005 TaxID=2942276 RepID=UPI002018A0A4|nr:Crp/Fnr family transcriptional regulator [Marivita sp. GX14005]MCL3882931.1 Crp/Fnr family transcriptional regulator [Marivita sp. GX14005]